MKCEECDTDELSRVVYVKGKRLCLGCGGGNHSNPAYLHRVAINKRKYGISMTHSEVMQIRTNKKQPDGSYAPDKRWRE